MIFSIQGANPETVLARQLGLRLAPSGWIEVDSEQKTSVEGVFAAGPVSAVRARARRPP